MIQVLVQNLGALWHGLLTTLALTGLAFAGALVLGTVMAVFRVSPIAPLRVIGAVFVELLRNVPLLSLLILFAYGLPYLGVSMSLFTTAVVCLLLVSASFVCEAVRGGINAVPVGQAEAARAIGLSFLPTITTIVLPQAFRGAIAPLGNTLIALTKNTTVLATIGVAEPALMMRNMLEFNSSLLFAIFFIMAAGFVILTLPMGIFFTWWSRKLAVQR